MPVRRNPPKVCANPQCPLPGRLFHPKRHYKTARACSHTCEAAVRGSAQMRAAGRRGGQESQRRARPGLLRRKAAEVVTSGMTPLEAFVAGAKWRQQQQHSTFYLRGRRAGYAAGFEDGLRAADPAYAEGCDLVSRGRVRAGDALLERPS